MGANQSRFYGKTINKYAISRNIIIVFVVAVHIVYVPPTATHTKQLWNYFRHFYIAMKKKKLWMGEKKFQGMETF